MTAAGQPRGGVEDMTAEKEKAKRIEGKSERKSCGDESKSPCGGLTAH